MHPLLFRYIRVPFLAIFAVDPGRIEVWMIVRVFLTSVLFVRRYRLSASVVLLCMRCASYLLARDVA